METFPQENLEPKQNPPVAQEVFSQHTENVLGSHLAGVVESVEGDNVVFSPEKVASRGLSVRIGEEEYRPVGYDHESGKVYLLRGDSRSGGARTMSLEEVKTHVVVEGARFEKDRPSVQHSSVAIPQFPHEVRGQREEEDEARILMLRQELGLPVATSQPRSENERKAYAARRKELLTTLRGTTEALQTYTILPEVLNDFTKTLTELAELVQYPNEARTVLSILEEASSFLPGGESKRELWDRINAARQKLEEKLK